MDVKPEIRESVGHVLGTESGSVTFEHKDCENCKGCRKILGW